MESLVLTYKGNFKEVTPIFIILRLRNFAGLNQDKIMLRFFVCVYIIIATSAFRAKDAISYYQSGLKHIDNKNFIAAISDFTHAISIKPAFKEAYYQRAKAKIYLNEEVKVVVKDIFNDLLKAQELGESEAIKLLMKKSEMECYTINANIDRKEDVFCLDYTNAALTKLPTHLDLYNSLFSLHLSYNKIVIIDKLPNLKNLLVLNINNNKLEKLPANISVLSALLELNASSNHLHTLPEEMVALKNLRVLYLRNNKLKKLPPQISNLQSLEILDLSLNQLKKLPAGLSTLKNLKALYLSGNDLSEKEVNLLKQQLSKTAIYF